MPFKDISQCKICNSLLRPDIDKMVAAGENYGKIADWAVKRGLDISRHNISKHKIRHTSIDDIDIEGRKQQELAKQQTKGVERDEIMKHVAAVTVLEEIVAKAYAGIQNNTLIPSIDNALKAIELQARLKEGHGLESQLIEFMMDFTREPTLVPHRVDMRIVKSTDRPEGIVNEMERLTNAKIQTGVKAIKAAEMVEIHSRNPRKYESTLPDDTPTVDDTLPKMVTKVIQTTLFQ